MYIVFITVYEIHNGCLPPLKNTKYATGSLHRRTQHEIRNGCSTDMKKKTRNGQATPSYTIVNRRKITLK